MSSSQKIILSLLRLLCRKYKLCILLGLLFIIFQGYSSYYIYQEIDGSIDGDTQILTAKDNRQEKISQARSSSSNYFLKYIKQPNIKSLYPQSTEKESTFTDGCKDNYGIFCPCSLQTKEALSAIQRANSLHCKQKIANISCSIQNGTFYPIKLQSLCPSDGHTKGTYLGCFIDDRENRILNGYVKQLKKNSPSLCADICLQRGYIYSGVEYSKECFCGNKEIPEKQRVPDTECDMMCSGESTEEQLTCGGYLRVSIAETGLPKIIPHALKRPSLNDGPTVCIAYILVVNGRALRQVHRLIKALYHKNHFFFIHVDLRQNYLYRELLLLETVYPNVLLSRKRYSSIWGGTSLLSVLLHCMQELYKKKNWRWDYVINLSESDFPIKTNSMLVDFLTANKDRNFLKSHGHDTNKFIQKQGLDQTFLECETHMWRLGVRDLPIGIRMDGGSDWVCLTRDFVRYVTQNGDELVNGLLKYFSYTLLPGESFFHTVLKNSQFCQSVIDNNLHVTNWKRKLGCRCQYKHIVDWCGCSPNDFTLEDWPKIEAAMNRNLFFARKFEPVININVINKIDKLLYGPFDAATPNLKSYWENIFHYEDPVSSTEDIDQTIYHAAARLTQTAFKDYHNSQKIVPVEPWRYSNNTLNVVCDLIPTKILQAFSYKMNDLVEGLLVEFLGYSKSDQQNIRIQIWIQPRILTNIKRSEYAPHRLKRVEVGSQLDLKEQAFRDFGRCLGPKSTIAIMTWWHSSSEIISDVGEEQQHSDNILKPKIILIDPVGAIAAEVELTINEEEQAVDHTFTLNGPLRPGMWKSFVIMKGEILATVEFAILPFQFYDGKEISIADGRSVHDGPLKPYSDVNLTNSAYNLVKEAVVYPGNETLLKIATENSKKFGPELLHWIDQLFEKAYILKGICHLRSEDANLCIESLTFACPDVSWSSYSPDPKSTLGEVDPVTGRLNDPYRVRPMGDS